MESMKTSVQYEPKCKKVTICIWALTHIAVAALIFTLEFLRQGNVNDTQSDYQNSICVQQPTLKACAYSNDVIYYDVAFYDTPTDQYTDLDQATEY